MLQWLNNHLLPCAYHALFGIDCPLCGSQRAFMLLLEGQWTRSFAQYPPLIPVLLLPGFFMVQRIFRDHIPVKSFYRFSILVLVIIFVNYTLKMTGITG